MKTRKFLAIIMTMFMIVTGLPTMEISHVQAATTTEKLQSLMAQYVGTTWTDYYYGIQCKGFANLIFKELFGVTHIGAYGSEKYYIPSPSGATEIGRLNFNQMSLESAKALLQKGTAGDFIQVRRRGKTWGHSMIFVSQDSTGITVFDCNSDGACGVKSYHITWASFYEKNSAMSLYHATNYPDDTCTCSNSYAGNYIVTTDSLPLNMRSGHGTGYSLVTTIPKGSHVYVSKANGIWAHVEWNGKSGYCSMEYLTKESINEELPKIHVWISDDKMGEVPKEYEFGKMYYICYEVLDASTGQLFETSNNYIVKETLYGPDGDVVNTCEYENSNNNWIGYSTYVPGEYKGVVEVRGAYEGSYEVSYTLNEKVTATPVPTATPTRRPTATPVPTATPTRRPTATPVPTATPTRRPTATPKLTAIPTRIPTAIPTSTVMPTRRPTATPIKQPAKTPNLTTVPTQQVTITSNPTVAPTVMPFITVAPTNCPVEIVKPTETPFITQKAEVKYDIIETGEEDEEEEEQELQEGDIFEVKSAIYEITDASDTPTVELISYEKKSAKAVTIPAKVEYEDITYKVTGIGRRVFEKNKKLAAVTIGKNVTNIRAYAFYKDSKLKKVTIKSKNLATVEKKAFYGLPKKVTVKLPENKKQEYNQLLKDAGLGKR